MVKPNDDYFTTTPEFQVVMHPVVVLKGVIMMLIINIVCEIVF